MRSCTRWIVFGIFLLVQVGEAAAAWSPQVSHFQEPGGMRVFLVESHNNPMVVVRILTRGGSAYDPANKAGVASLTAWMLNEGGGALDSAALREKLDFFGISLGASVDRDVMTVSMTTLAAHLDEAWSILGDVLVRPRFDEKDFRRGREEILTALAKGKEKPDWLADRALYPMVYGNHPYGNPEQGTVDSIKSIRLDDLRDFHAQAFHTAEMVVAVAGDVTLERLKKLVAKHLAGLDLSPSPFEPLPTAPISSAGRTQHIAMDVAQTTIRMGIVGIHRHDPDYYAMTVMNQILGGSGFTSRFTEEIREKRGLAYGVYSYFLPWAARGPFVVGMETKTASTSEALRLLRAEMSRMVAQGVEEKELAEVKRYLIGSFPLNLDGLEKIAATWGVIGYYRRGVDYLEKWPERIQAVTQADVRRVALRILAGERLHVVTVGRAVTPDKP